MYITCTEALARGRATASSRGYVGSDEQPQFWSKLHVYNVSGGLPHTQVYPQIYCLGQAQQWLAIRNLRTFQFYGVTSTNGRGTCDAGPTMYGWQAAWSILNDKLSNAPSPGPYINNLYPNVTNFLEGPEGSRQFTAR